MSKYFAILIESSTDAWVIDEIYQVDLQTVQEVKRKQMVLSLKKRLTGINVSNKQASFYPSHF